MHACMKAFMHFLRRGATAAPAKMAPPPLARRLPPPPWGVLAATPSRIAPPHPTPRARWRGLTAAPAKMTSPCPRRPLRGAFLRWTSPLAAPAVEASTHLPPPPPPRARAPPPLHTRWRGPASNSAGMASQPLAPPMEGSHCCPGRDGLMPPRPSAMEGPTATTAGMASAPSPPLRWGVLRPPGHAPLADRGCPRPPQLG